MRVRVRSWIVSVLLMAGPASAQEFHLLEATIADVHTALEAGTLTCRSLVRAYLDRIDAYDERLNSIQTINSRALQEADALDASYAASGLKGPLHCIPVLLKDQVETSDMPTSYGSVIFEDFVPQREATIVIKMKEAGAIILAKTTMGEFASRYVGSAFGIIRNAYDPSRNPSGSSGGTGVGVAANFGMVGIGEDTGGSIRGPAAVASLVGLRPTTPLVSRYGMMPAIPANDTLGPMTRTVRDAAVLLDVIAGFDPNDPITAHAAGQVPSSYTESLEEDGLREARVGVLRQSIDRKTDPSADDFASVRAVFDRAVAELAAHGAELVDPISIDHLELADPLHFNEDFTTERVTDEYLAEHPNAPAKTLKEILLTGKVTPWRAAGLVGALGREADESEHLQVLLAKERLRQSVLVTMAEHDLDAIVYPTFEHEPSRIADDALTNPDTADEYGKGDNRWMSPRVGFPALTVPAGFTDNGMPVGLEIMGRPFTERMLLQYAYAYEQATKQRRPPKMPPELPSESPRD
jgi:Asp-tRNA(Asn)/Glu-tRNA(Gln) amidotransferase A subunit family amidase